MPIGVIFDVDVIRNETFEDYIPADVNSLATLNN